MYRVYYIVVSELEPWVRIRSSTCERRIYIQCLWVSVAPILTARVWASYRGSQSMYDVIGWVRREGFAPAFTAVRFITTSPSFHDRRPDDNSSPGQNEYHSHDFSRDNDIFHNFSAASAKDSFSCRRAVTSFPRDYCYDLS